MDGKVIGIAVAVIVIVAAVGATIALSGGGDENDGFVGVVYDGNGGTTSDGSTYYRLTSTTVLENRFSNGGHVFTGWNTAADGSGTSYSAGGTVSYPSNGHTTLYAQWSSSTYYYIDKLSSDISGSSLPTLGYYVTTDLGTTQITAVSYSSTPLASTTLLSIIGTGTSDWTWDSENSRFSFTYNGSQYYLWFTFSNGVTASYYEGATYPSLALSVTENIDTLTIHLRSA